MQLDDGSGCKLDGNHNHIFCVSEILAIVEQAFGASDIPSCTRNQFLAIKIGVFSSLLPPWMKTSTGFKAPAFGFPLTQTFALKQSSDWTFPS
jgi:hypothetical protein